MRITNLDSLNGEDQAIILDGKEWIFPGELPVDYVLQLIDLQQKIQDDPEDFQLWEKQQELILEVLNKRQPELTLDQLKKLLTAKQTGALIGVFMNSLGAKAEEELEEEKKSIEILDSNSSEESPRPKKKMLTE